MTFISQLLSLYIWIATSVLVLFLFIIARFFDKRRQKQSPANLPYPLHWWLLAAIVCFLIAAIGYAIAGKPILVGIPAADALRILGGIIITFVSISLLNSMIGGRS